MIMSWKYVLWNGRRRYLTVLVLLITIGLVRLGFWQLERHEQRVSYNTMLSERMALPPLAVEELLALPEDQREFRNVIVTGTYLPDQQILWRNREYQGVTGFHVLTPLERADGSRILVNRGWISYQNGLTDWQSVYAPPTTPQTIIGSWRISQLNTGQANETPVKDGWRERWFLIDIPQIAQIMATPLVDGFVDVQPDGQPTPRNQPIPAVVGVLSNGNHLSYAVQWFGFAIILVVGYAIALQRIGRPQPDAT